MVVVEGSGRIPIKPSTKRTVATKVCRKNESPQPVWYLSGKNPKLRMHAAEENPSIFLEKCIRHKIFHLPGVLLGKLSLRASRIQLESSNLPPQALRKTFLKQSRDCNLPSGKAMRTHTHTHTYTHTHTKKKKIRTSFQVWETKTSNFGTGWVSTRHG